MSERCTKGTNLANIVSFIDNHYSHSDRQKIYTHISNELKSKLKDIDSSAWYPVEHENELERAMAKVAANEAEVEANARALGRHIFNQALGTFMRLVIRVLTPAMFFKKTGEIWPRMFDFGSFQADASAIKDNRAVMHMRGVEGCDYIPAVSAGFIEQAVTAIGYANVAVKVSPIDGEPAGNFRFDVQWS